MNLPGRGQGRAIALAVGLILVPQVRAQTTHSHRAAPAANVLWRNPGRVETLDLTYGVGGRAKFPRAPFYFREEDLSGSNPKIEVKDARGVEWSVKWSEEAKPEVFASRLAWACGYIAQPEYFVPGGKILNVKRLARARSLVKSDGSFEDARFQLRTKSPKFLKKDNWSWSYNPFVGSKELNGLKVLMIADLQLGQQGRPRHRPRLQPRNL